jgi:hypothetical protein
MQKLYIVGLFVLAGVFLLYGFVNPSTYSFFPQCPFHVLTGLDCPGCGSQRALHSLLNGNLKEAADYNLLLVFSIPLLVVHFRYKAASIFTGRDIRFRALDYTLTPILIFILVVGFAVLRNLPTELGNYLKA